METKPKTCKNCNEKLRKDDRYCSNCGAKIVYNRITLKRILSDAAETVFGWDNKYFYTLRSLVLKPHIVLEDYVSGVRKRYVHPFTFLIIGATLTLLTFTFFLDQFMGNLEAFNIRLVERYNGMGVKDLDLDRVDKVQAEILKYFNIVTLLLIPLYSIFTYTIYRKTFNYAEHLVFNAFVQGTGFIFAIVFFYLSLITHPMVYSLTTLAIWFIHAYIFGKLFRLNVGMSFLKLILFNIMSAVSLIVIVGVMVLIGILIAYLK
ncbi:DUF3667 domain-containing protein [Croceitalea rosinachiae]|uniref:DUF3667 domain-containing protein n=1 Tax=Croceitalea rosinachiae TaxID=3075596 RepID=A0ABU3A8S8_9FLAO|nr:DUF3667 domain-containing protein [Croceitalea sp. F388]MDT0606576.1 DUF3667 domain-containing protein [Croceitalea sp. F388]